MLCSLLAAPYHGPMWEISDASEVIEEIGRRQAEPDYLSALDAVCRKYEELLASDLKARADLNGSGPRVVLGSVERLRYARGARDAFAAGGFDALFDFQCDFCWRHAA